VRHNERMFCVRPVKNIRAANNMQIMNY